LIPSSCCCCGTAPVVGDEAAEPHHRGKRVSRAWRTAKALSLIHIG
jgi:hypothetical protein